MVRILTIAAVMLFAAQDAVPPNKQLNPTALIDYQKVAEGAGWAWSLDKANPFYSMTRYRGRYIVALEQLPATPFPGPIMIHFSLEGRRVYSWKGHEHTVFACSEDTAFITDFSTGTFGCSVVAVHLPDGKDLWRTKLKAVGMVEHSTYANLININAQSKDIITIYGNEGGGQYIELIDQATGTTVGNHRFPKAATDERLLSLRKVVDSAFHACEYGYPEFVPQLLEAGLSVDAVSTDGSRRSLVQVAAARGQTPLVRLFLDQRCNVNARDSTRLTPLHWACGSYTGHGKTYASADMVRLLIDHGADVNAEDDSKRTPLHRAVEFNATELISVLLEHGANAKAADASLYTALHKAALKGNIDIMKMLVAAGANVNAVDSQKATPAKCARHRGHTDALEWLIQHGGHE